MANKKRGKIILVGAGPGDAGLLTVKAVNAIQTADVILFDNLVGKGVLAHIPASAEILYVGKSAGRHTAPQEQINAILKEKALGGKTVVRLKGGDPFLFGRGGEELEGVREAGIDFEVVPGVTSAFAVPAYCGIPVTHRDHCSSVHIITAHSKRAPGEGIAFDALVKGGGTLIFLMGVSALRTITEGLARAGMPADTPAAILEQGTTAAQRKVISTLGSLVRAAAEAEIKAPAITVVGDVCKLSEELAWRERQPLFGLRIGVARPADRGSRLSELLANAGAEVVEIPAIVTNAIPEVPRFGEIIGTLREKDWIAFTSPFGVKVFFGKLFALGIDIRTLAGLRFAAIGRSTARALESRGLIPAVCPAHYSAKELGEALAQEAAPGETVLLPRAAIGEQSIVTCLQNADLKVIDLPIYETRQPDAASGTLYEAMTKDGFDWLAFTSASTVESFAGILGAEKLKESKALCIGGQTAAAAKKYGMQTCVAENAALEEMLNRISKETETK